MLLTICIDIFVNVKVLQISDIYKYHQIPNSEKGFKSQAIKVNMRNRGLKFDEKLEYDKFVLVPY